MVETFMLIQTEVGRAEVARIGSENLADRCPGRRGQHPLADLSDRVHIR